VLAELDGAAWWPEEHPLALLIDVPAHQHPIAVHHRAQSHGADTLIAVKTGSFCA
jgi:hypothetical protein